jgi:hypothetical protein
VIIHYVVRLWVQRKADDADDPPGFDEFVPASLIQGSEVRIVDDLRGLLDELEPPMPLVVEE